MTDQAGCPRCSGPLRLFRGEERVGVSITGFGGGICGPCAADEALRLLQASELIPSHEWPHRDGAHEFLLRYGREHLPEPPSIARPRRALQWLIGRGLA